MSMLKGLLAGLFFLVITGFLGWLVGGDLWADVQNRSARYEPVRDARITEARCKSRLFVISFCDIKAEGPGITGNKREFNYFLLGGVGDARLSLQRAVGPSAPATRHITTDYGIENMTTRIVSFVALIGALAALTIGGFIAAFRKSA